MQKPSEHLERFDQSWSRPIEEGMAVDGEAAPLAKRP
jgi:hypothetical protein